MEQELFLTYTKPEKTRDLNVVVVTCMDDRLVELAHKALNLTSGEAKIIKNAGALISHPFGSVMRSLIVAVYELKADEIIIMGHKDCGMSKVNTEKMIHSMLDRGINRKDLDLIQYTGIDFERWLRGFSDVFQSVKHDVNLVKNHPLLPSDVPVHGLVIDPETGALDLVVDGYQNVKG
ncbi:beta-class carbonic anhydrase [Streptococcus ovuberis]|uniref:beta-class carbonic anhydrase n=1 Tax=Streptococcus ovuberis TaxID=1936207 RepID=UPI001B34EA52